MYRAFLRPKTRLLLTPKSLQTVTRHLLRPKNRLLRPWNLKNITPKPVTRVPSTSPDANHTSMPLERVPGYEDESGPSIPPAESEIPNAILSLKTDRLPSSDLDQLDRRTQSMEWCCELRMGKAEILRRYRRCRKKAREAKKRLEEEIRQLRADIETERELMQEAAKCTVCGFRMVNARITRCGHTFCLECLEGWFATQTPKLIRPPQPFPMLAEMIQAGIRPVSRDVHTCPACRDPVILSRLTRNYMFDAVLEVIPPETTDSCTK